MSKVLKIAMIATAVVVTAGYGGFLTGALTSLMGTSFTALNIAMNVVGAMAIAGGLAALGMAAKALSKKSQMNNAAYERLHKQVQPTAYRKICFGETAMGTDVRFNEKFGNDDKYVEVIALASHNAAGIDRGYLKGDVAW